MKNNLVKLYIAAFYFCSIFAMFAQTPGTENGQTGEGALEDTGVTDTTPMPIDEKLIVLAIVGVCLAYFTFRKYKKHSAV